MITLSSRGAGGPEGSAPAGNLEGRFLVAALLGMTEEVSRLTPERDRTAPRPWDFGLPATDYRLPTGPSSCRLSILLCEAALRCEARTVDCRLSP